MKRLFVLLILLVIAAIAVLALMKYGSVEAVIRELSKCVAVIWNSVTSCLKHIFDSVYSQAQSLLK